MKKMKKLLLAVGTAATVVAPIATVVSCGSSSTTPSKSNGANTNGANTNGANTNGANTNGAKDQVISLSTVETIPVAQYNAVYNSYADAYTSYTTNLKKISDGIKKVQDKLKEVNGAATPTPLQAFAKTILGDGTKLNPILTEAVTEAKPSAKRAKDDASKFDEIGKYLNADGHELVAATAKDVTDFGNRAATQADVDKYGNRLATQADYDKLGNKPATQADVDKYGNRKATQADVDKYGNRKATAADVTKYDGYVTLGEEIDSSGMKIEASHPGNPIKVGDDIDASGNLITATHLGKVIAVGTKIDIFGNPISKANPGTVIVVGTTKVDAHGKLITANHKGVDMKVGDKINTNGVLITATFKGNPIKVGDFINTESHFGEKVVKEITNRELEISEIKQAEFDLRKNFNEKVSNIVFKVSGYLKDTITGDGFTTALDKLVDAADSEDLLDQLQTFISGFIPSDGPMALANTAISTIFDSIGDKIDADEAGFKTNIKTVIDVIDFQKIFEKINYYNGPDAKSKGFIPELSKTADGASNLMSNIWYFSNIEGLLVGDMITTNQKTYTGAKVATNGGNGAGLLATMVYLPVLMGDKTMGSATTTPKLEAEMPALKNIAPVARALTDLPLTMLFEGFPPFTLPEAFSALDLNLKSAKIPAFVKLINDSMHSSLDSLDFTQLLKSSYASKIYDLIIPHANDEGMIGTIVKPIIAWLGTDKTAAITKLQTLIKNVGPLLNDLKDKLLEIADNIAKGTADKKYVVVTDDKTLNANLRRALIDLLSIDLKDFNQAAITSLKSIFPSLIDGTVLQNALQQLFNYIKGHPSVGDLLKGDTFKTVSGYADTLGKIYWDVDVTDTTATLDHNPKATK